jgi:formate/nitrite transporter FocA (FNT family)
MTSRRLDTSFFPIMAFVVAGFEHSIANMYYLAAGLFTVGQTGAAAEGLTWGRALIGNLLPVTLGNLVGGGLLVGVSAWYLYLKKEINSVNS